MKTRQWIVAAIVLTTSACMDGEPPPDSVTHRDSAGIEIVENGSDQLDHAEQWILSPEPALVISSNEELDIALYRVVGVVPLPGGRIAVLNSGFSQVLVFDDDGNLTIRLGREGDGPGEFRSTTSVISLPGDSIGVYDDGRREFSVFDGEGELVRSVGLREILDGRFTSELLPLASGDLAVFTTGGFSDELQEGVYRVQTESLRLNSAGEVVASYGTFPGREVFTGDRAMGSPLFATSSFASTLRDQLVVGEGTDSEFTIFGPTGAPVRIVRWPDRDRELPAGYLETFLAAAQEAQPETPPEAARQMLSIVPVAERKPPFWEILSSDSGHLWLGSYPGLEYVIPERPPPARQWLVFDPTGVLVARVDTPEGFRLGAINRSKIYGVFTDELGVESVRVYGFGNAER